MTFISVLGRFSRANKAKCRSLFEFKHLNSTQLKKYSRDISFSNEISTSGEIFLWSIYYFPDVNVKLTKSVYSLLLPNDEEVNELLVPVHYVVFLFSKHAWIGRSSDLEAKLQTYRADQSYAINWPRSLYEIESINTSLRLVTQSVLPVTWRMLALGEGDVWDRCVSRRGKTGPF